jgi:hypothetical protein
VNSAANAYEPPGTLNNLQTDKLPAVPLDSKRLAGIANPAALSQCGFCAITLTAPRIAVTSAPETAALTTLDFHKKDADDDQLLA